MTLLIVLLGAALLLSGLVLLAGFRRRGEEPREFAMADGSRAVDRVEGPPAGNNWMFGGAGGPS